MRDKMRRKESSRRTNSCEIALDEWMVRDGSVGTWYLHCTILYVCGSF